MEKQSFLPQIMSICTRQMMSRLTHDFPSSESEEESRDLLDRVKQLRSDTAVESTKTSANKPAQKKKPRVLSQKRTLPSDPKPIIQKQKVETPKDHHTVDEPAAKNQKRIGVPPKKRADTWTKNHDNLDQNSHASMLNDDDFSRETSSDEEFVPCNSRKRDNVPFAPIITVQQGVKLESVPTFNPKECKYRIDQWIALLEQLQQIYTWNESSIIYHMQARLKGTAKTWYKLLDDYPTKWESWKILLQKTFREKNCLVTDIENMRQRVKQKTESYEEYFFAKLVLLRLCRLESKAQIIDCTVRINAYRQWFKEVEDLRHHLITVCQEITPKNLNRETKPSKLNAHCSDSSAGSRLNNSSRSSSRSQSANKSNLIC